MSILFIAILVGFLFSAPVGPIALLCIGHTLKGGFKRGVYSAFGASLSDALYATLSVVTLNYLVSFLDHRQTLINIFGGIFLVLLGLKIGLTKQERIKMASNKKSGHIKAFLTTLLTTLANPLVIIVFSLIFSRVNFTVTEKYNELFYGLSIFVGIFLGSMVWWLILVSSISILFKKVQHKFIELTNKVSGLCISLIGLFIIFGFFNERSIALLITKNLF